jgi:hypothetical protein
VLERQVKRLQANESSLQQQVDQLQYELSLMGQRLKLSESNATQHQQSSGIDPMLDPFGTAEASFEQTGTQFFSPRNVQAPISSTAVWIETHSGKPHQMHVQQSHGTATARGLEADAFGMLSPPYDFSTPSQAVGQFGDQQS